jgi:hypothetical protein
VRNDDAQQGWRQPVRRRDSAVAKKEREEDEKDLRMVQSGAARASISPTTRPLEPRDQFRLSPKRLGCPVLLHLKRCSGVPGSALEEFIGAAYHLRLPL